MATEQQIAANRLNAQRSSGPKTEEGKKRSSMNALRHGLTGQVTAMTDGDRAAHDRFCKALIHSLESEGAMEIQLAQRIATDSWRGHLDEAARPYPRSVLAKRSTCGQRAGSIEDNLFALRLHENGGKLCLDDEQVDAALTTARVFTMESKTLQLLTLYEQRLNRAIQKNLAILQSLQSVRKAERETAMKEAANLLKLSEIRGLEYFPEKAAKAQVRCAANSRQDGFVFSTREIHAVIDRKQRLQLALTTDFSKFEPGKFQGQAA